MLSCAFSMAAQDDTGPPPAGNSLVLKKTVNRVIVDVVVTDGNGHPVRGLTGKDFSIQEDGKAQKILSFDIHDLTAAYVPPKLPRLPANTFLDVPSAPERGPLYVLLYDLVNTEIEDQATARRQLLKFIQTKPEGARFAIFVLADELRLVQGFTSDEKRLFAALDPNSPKPHVPRIFLMGRNSGRGDVGLMVSVLNRICGFLDGLPGRKNLIWLSGQFPVSLFPTDDDGQTYRAEIQETLNTMARSQIAMYPVDVRGVVVTNSYAPSGATPGGGVYADSRSGRTLGSAAGGTSTPASGGAGATVAPTTAAAPGPGYSLLNSSYSTQDEIAHETGGHAFHSTNGLTQALAAATDIGANYYSLSYSPSNENYDGKLRRIQVEVDRKGYDLSYRRSYYGEDPNAPRRQPNRKALLSPDLQTASHPGELLYADMQHGAPMAHDLFFSVHIHPIAAASLATPAQMKHFNDQFDSTAKHPKYLSQFEVQPYVADFFVPTRQFPQHASRGMASIPALQFTTVVYDSEGAMVNSIVQMAEEASSVEESSNGQPRGYHVLQEIDVPAAAASIRVAVRDISSDHIGALEVTLPLAAEATTQAAAPNSDHGDHSSASPN